MELFAGHKTAGEWRRADGFTLLELIVAFTIMALMAGLVFFSLRLALNAYERSQVRLESQVRQWILADEMRRQIGSLFPLRPTPALLRQQQMGGGEATDPLLQMMQAQAPLFVGESTYMTFITVAPLYQLRNPGLTVVTYGLAEDEFGRPYLGAMETPFSGLESFLLMADSGARANLGKPLPLVQGIANLQFQYYGFDPQAQLFTWFEMWRGDEMMSLPTAVRISFDAQTVLATVNATAFPGGGRDVKQAIQGLLQGE